MSKTVWVVLAALGALAGCAKDADELSCDVAIVGGGAAGLHTAFRLAPAQGERVCLFEKEEQLGGRIRDESESDAPAAPRIGTGARRVMEGQDLVFALAAELGLGFEKPTLGTDLINARGLFSFSKDDFRAVYPKLQPSTDPMVDQETFLYDLLRKGPARPRTGEYADFRSYIRDVAGEEGFAYLRDMSRFRADFDYALSPSGYLEYLDEEWDVCCTPSYPIGGMSAFIDAMEQRTVAAGARIFKGDAVLAIDREGGGYRLRTQRHSAFARRVVVAAPPTGLEHVDGEVARAIKARPEYQNLQPVKVVVVNQFWDEAWWKVVHDPQKTMDARVWRAWTTEHCLNFIEIPIEPYAEAQKVTRSVYSDDLLCAAFWEELSRQGIDRVEAEVVRGLRHLFDDNGASAPAQVTIPKPRKTTLQIWPGGWYFLRAGAPFGSRDIERWSLEPLPGEPGVMLVGEAYFPRRSGWSDGAYKSSNALLAARFGVQPPQALTVPPARAVRRFRAEGGH